MYKSTIGIFISNLLMIWIVLLNNEGPGWEVSVETMQSLVIASLLLAISMTFSIMALLIGLRKLKIRGYFFNVSFFVYFFVCIVFVVFLFCVQGYSGQFWFDKFPSSLFIIVSLIINVLLFALVSISRFKKSKQAL